MKKDIVTVSALAKDYISDLCKDGTVLCVSVSNKGCSGHRYEYSMIPLSSIGDRDEVISWEGGALVVLASSVFHLLGSTLDLKGTMFERYLHWENPNAQSYCGCGESFSVKI